MANEKNLREVLTTIDDLVDDLETRLGASTKTTGDLSIANNTNDQDFLESTVAHVEEVAAYLDFNAAAQNKTVDIQVKNKDGTYRKIDPQKEWTQGTSRPGVLITFRAVGDFKITIKNGTGEAITVPYTMVRRVVGA